MDGLGDSIRSVHVASSLLQYVFDLPQPRAYPKTALDTGLLRSMVFGQALISLYRA